VLSIAPLSELMDVGVAASEGGLRKRLYGGVGVLALWSFGWRGARHVDSASARLLPDCVLKAGSKIVHGPDYQAHARFFLGECPLV
jgi:hypothetical protein